MTQPGSAKGEATLGGLAQEWESGNEQLEIEEISLGSVDKAPVSTPGEGNAMSCRAEAGLV